MKIIIPILMSSLLWIPGVAMATEEPKYTVLTQIEDFELRRYEAQIAAQTWVTGDQDAASRQGFKTLAGYIFGNNTAENGNSSKISMTSPVMMRPQQDTNDSDQTSNDQTQSQKIAMTAPVMMQKAQQNKDKWRVQFIMPSHYTMQTLPKPNNPNITITEVPVKTYAVVKFSGLAGTKKVEDKTKELQFWMKGQNLTATSIPELARYNPPWTLPFMRRNEIMIAYQKQ